jgi:NADH-quinone oxidoreductase subunit L
LEPIFTKVKAESHGLGPTEYMLMGIATIGALVGIGIAYAKYIKHNTVPETDDKIVGFSKVLYNKYYVDEFYTAIIVNPINRLSKLFRDNVERYVSFAVLGLGKTAVLLGSQGRKLQNGNIGLYLFVFVLGFCAILSYLFLAQ